MIRDYCKISGKTLDQEIKQLRESFRNGDAPSGVTEESIDAIDHVRSVGNIGAHMEKDINLIIDIEPNEAAALINLIEMLFDEWYVARHKRQGKLLKVKQISHSKKEMKTTKSLPDIIGK